MKSRAVHFTRAEAEALLNLMHFSGFTGVQSSMSKEDAKAVDEVHNSLPIAARKRTAAMLNDKIWNIWADTHPEEGPFK